MTKVGVNNAAPFVNRLSMLVTVSPVNKGLNSSINGETLPIKLLVSLTNVGVKSCSADDSKLASDEAVPLLTSVWTTERISFVCSVVGASRRRARLLTKDSRFFKNVGLSKPVIPLR